MATAAPDTWRKLAKPLGGNPLADARALVAAMISGLVFPSLADGQPNQVSDSELIATYSQTAEFQAATSIIWCEPVPECHNWRLKSHDSDDSAEPQDKTLGSVFIFVIVETEEALSKDVEVFVYALAESLNNQKIEILALALIPPGNDTDRLRGWIEDQCLSCP